MLSIIIGILFITALCLIVCEEILKLNKAKSTLFFGTLAWIILFMSASITHQGTDEVHHLFNENILEIAGLWLFLMCAMTFVAYLDRRQLLEFVFQRILPEKISYKKLLFLIGVVTFFFSSIADNLTATIVALACLLCLHIDKKEMVKFAVFIVFSANAGGVFLITGDVTTLMIFQAGVISIAKILPLILPSIVAFLTLYALLAYNLKGELTIEKGRKWNFRKSDIAIACSFLLTIALIMIGHMFFHIPPLLVFMFGLSIMFLVGWITLYNNNQDLQLIEYMRDSEFESLIFFLGILLLVGAVKEVHLLDYLVQLYVTINPYLANYTMGVLSALVDNIPLTAVLLKSNLDLTVNEWQTLVYAVGVGGSLLSVGSAAGVVAMSKIKEITFVSYLKYTFHILIAYSVGYISCFIL